MLQCVAEFAAMSDSPEAKHEESAPASPEADETATVTPPKEIGGRDGPEPVRYGDWEKNGRCIDF